MPRPNEGILRRPDGQTDGRMLPNVLSRPTLSNDLMVYHEHMTWYVKSRATMISVANEVWPIFGPFDPYVWPDVQEISKDNHISLENSGSALSHWAKPIYENLDQFLQSNGSKNGSRCRIWYQSSVTLHICIWYGVDDEWCVWQCIKSCVTKSLRLEASLAVWEDHLHISPPHVLRPPKWEPSERWHATVLSPSFAVDENFMFPTEGIFTFTFFWSITAIRDFLFLFLFLFFFFFFCHSTQQDKRGELTYIIWIFRSPPALW